MPKKRIILSTVTAAATATALIFVGTGAATASTSTPTTAVAHTKPTWLAHATHLGAAKASAAVTARVYLAPKGGTAALEAAVTAASTPGNAAYGKYLSASQYVADYAPTAQTVSAVSNYLTSTGLRVTQVGADNSYLAVTGDVSAAERSFSTTIERYRHNGTTVQAPSSALALPTTIAAAVAGITGVDTTPSRMKPQAATPVPLPTGYRNVTPGCSAYYGQNKAAAPLFNGKKLAQTVCGYIGKQLRSAYLHGGSRSNGAGVTVAIIDAYSSPTIYSDSVKYAARHGDAPFRPGQYTENTLPADQYTNLDECEANGWFGEQTLDVQSLHALAQGAKIRYYGAASCNDDDLIAAFQRVLHENRASVVTNSYGEPELEQDPSVIPEWHLTFLRAAMQGISVLFSSGDDGDEGANTGTVQADGAASDPFVTAVGGTSTEIGKNGALVGQTGWGTEKYTLSTDGTSWNPVGFLYGAGGGFSQIWNRPWYQRGSVDNTGRGVPDVAMNADPTTGFLIGQTQVFTDGTYYGESRYGGTSLASPLFAAMTAIRVQHSGHRLGFLNPCIYANQSKFIDVAGPLQDAGNVRVDFVNGENVSGGLAYSVRTFDQDSSLTVGRGWDDVTGVGVPSAGWALR